MFLYSNTFNIFNILVIILSIISLFFLGFNLIHAYQIAGYKLSHFFNYLKKTKFNIAFQFLLSTLSFVFLFISNFIVSLYNLSIYCTYASVCIYYILCFLFYKLLFKTTFKVPFNKTKRIRRFMFVYMLICTLLSCLALFLNNFVAIYFKFCFIVVLPILLSLVVVISHFVSLPLENAVKLFYIIKCKLKLKKYKNLKMQHFTKIVQI